MTHAQSLIYLATAYLMGIVAQMRMGITDDTERVRCAWAVTSEFTPADAERFGHRAIHELALRASSTTASLERELK